MEPRALVLAAGRGLRMRPLTEDRAKPALPILGMSLVGRVVQHLRRSGVAAAGVNAFHASESLAYALARDTYPVPTLYREPVLMGTGGALDAPRTLLAESDCFILHNGDTLVEAPVARLLDAARAPGCLGALLVRVPAVEGYTPLAVREGRLVGWQRPDRADPNVSSATYLGVAALRREVLENVPTNAPAELFDDVLRPLMEERKAFLAAVPHAGRWLEFTSPASYAKRLLDLVRDEAEQGAVRLPGGIAMLDGSADGRWFRDSRASMGEVRISGAAVIEREARVEDGCHLQDCLVLEGARLGARCSVRRGIVGPGAAIAPGEEIRDAIVTAIGAEGQPRRLWPLSREEGR